ncbi:MAG: hypothetical protein IPG04_10720 [Polyangiaceae bacterium]|nr:hypothetical protein [Polyangiaceae bacterium]
MNMLRRFSHALSTLALLAAACGDDAQTGGTGGSGNGSNNGGEGTGNSMNTGGEGTGNGSSNGGGGSTSNGGSGQGGGEGGAFECTDPDVNVPESECDLYLQDCPVATDTCEIGDADPDNPAFEPTTVCITKNGLKAIGESCNTTEDCQLQLTCVGQKCTPFCCEGDDAICGGGDCNITVQITDENQEPTGYTFKACSFASSCDLFTPTDCPSGENCYLTDPGVTSCYNADEGNEIPDGQPCMFLNDCADSAICIGDENGMNSVCRYLCETGSNLGPGLGGCPGGQLCDTNALDTGIAGVGFCHP